VSSLLLLWARTETITILGCPSTACRCGRYVLTTWYLLKRSSFTLPTLMRSYKGKTVCLAIKQIIRVIGLAGLSQREIKIKRTLIKKGPKHSNYSPFIVFNKTASLASLAGYPCKSNWPIRQRLQFAVYLNAEIYLCKVNYQYFTLCKPNMTLCVHLFFKQLTEVDLVILWAAIALPLPHFFATLLTNKFVTGAVKSLIL